jgi:D-xylose transport system permease protein
MAETVEKKRFKIETSALRAYTMLGALVVISIFFHYATNPETPDFWSFGEHLKFFFSGNWIADGTFLKPRNLANLMTQMSVTGILAVGMLMIIVSGNIDLSVGSVLAFVGGVAAYSLTNMGFGLPATIAFVIIAGALIGLFQGSLITYFNIPAFIVTLGGLLAWRGAVKWLLAGNTIPVSNETFNGIGQANIPASAGWVVAGIAILFVIFMAYKSARSVKDYGLGEANYTRDLLKAIIPVVAILAFIWVMNTERGARIPESGVPVPVMILVAVALFGAFLTNSTTFGRYLYAIGGNSDAARLSGINNRRNVLAVYALLGVFTGIAALIYTGRQGSAAPDAGTLKELDAIAACVIGGASLVGGRGTVFGACLGALIMASLDNGMSLIGIRDFMQDIIKGSILVAAVGLDMAGRKQG